MTLYIILWIELFMGGCGGIVHNGFCPDPSATQRIEFTMDRREAENHLGQGHDVYQVNLLFQSRPKERYWRVKKLVNEATYSVVTKPVEVAGKRERP